MRRQITSSEFRQQLIPGRRLTISTANCKAADRIVEHVCAMSYILKDDVGHEYNMRLHGMFIYRDGDVFEVTGCSRQSAVFFRFVSTSPRKP